MADFASMKDEVTRTEGIVPSVVALLNSVADQIAAAVEADNIADNAEIAGLSDRLRAQADALAAAVEANPGPPPEA